MNRPALDSADSSVVIGRYLIEIEELLCVLAGVEAFWDCLEADVDDYIDAVDDWEESGGPSVTAQDGDFQVPGAYGFTITHLYYFRATDFGESRNKLQTKAESAYQVGTGRWSGVGDRCARLVEGVVRPDVSSMAESAHAMAGVADFLLDHSTIGAPAFVSELKRSWPATSLGSASFYRFYEDLADLCGQYEKGAALLALTTARATNLVDQFQENLTDVLPGTYDHLSATLQQWAEFGGPSDVETTETPSDNLVVKILDGTSTATGLLALAPSPAEPALGWASAITGALSWAIDAPTITTEITTVSKSADIKRGLLDAVTRLSDELGLGLDQLHHGGASGGGPADEPSADFSAFVRTALANPNWEPVRVDL